LFARLVAESSKSVHEGEPILFPATFSPRFVDGIAAPEVRDWPRFRAVSDFPILSAFAVAGQTGRCKVRALLNRRSSLDWWRARRMKPVAKAQEDRQSFIDGSHLFPIKFAIYAPDPPLVD
jgi:hypothetical protein